jgi:hypothetical protein
MSRKSKQDQVQELRFDLFVSSMLRAIPGGSPPSKQSKSFERDKEALESRLKAEIALTTDKGK